MNIKTQIISSAIVALALGSAQVQAGGSSSTGHRDYHVNGDRSTQSYQEYARVVHVEPQYRTVRVEAPREQCWEERVSYNDGYGHSNGHSSAGGKSYTPQILGAVVGAAVGRKFGRGRGQDAATVAGAVLGGSIGRDINRQHRHRRNGHNNAGYNNHRQSNQYQVIERCETVNDYRNEERLDGYRVEYEYEGRRYWTNTDYDPGNQIAVNVTVRPQIQ